jgi:hypothetical protein
MPQHLLSRRNALRIVPALALVSVMPRFAQAAVIPEIIAYRNPGCGCCEKWAAGLQAAGFRITMTDDPDLDARRAKAGVPQQLAGCHTAFMGSYVIEGHVPAADIIRLLEEKPEALGLAVPGMPMGSPGMEMDGAKDAFDVMLFTRDGKSRVYASH